MKPAAALFERAIKSSLQFKTSSSIFVLDRRARQRISAVILVVIVIMVAGSRW
jgi:hypothetical protein